MQTLNNFMRIKILTLFLSLSIIIFCYCSSDLDEFNRFRQIEYRENWPETSKQLGQGVAKELNITIRNLHKQGVDYSNANESLEFKENFYNDFYNANPNICKTKGSIYEYNISPERFVEQVKNLTKIQIEFLNRIIDECNSTTSIKEYYNVLLKINEDIYEVVPQIQQERLFNVTSVLYYGMKEIQYLESQGLMIHTSRTATQHILIKTRSESNENFGELCHKVLATSMLVAIATPIPGDEIMVIGAATAVATGFMVYTAGVMLYEYLVCKKFDKTADENYEYCQQEFESCYSEIIDGCSICLQFCLTQGYWPPYSTHKCKKQ